MKAALKTLKQYKTVAVVMAVLVLPLAYSFFYLWAFWDPYSLLSELPIAVVNMDKGAELNGKMKNVGQGIVDNLESSTAVKWVFTTEADMEDGLANRKYYGAVVFPENFSKNIATVDDLEKAPGLFIYKINEKRNFLAGQVMNRVAVELKENITQSITKEIVNAMAGEMEKVPNQLGELADGLAKIDDGSSQLYDKMGDLVAGQRKFNTGARELSLGIAKASSGSKQLAEGAQRLDGGAVKIAGGLEALSQGSSKLTAGSTQVSEGLAAFETKFTAFESGLTNYFAGISQSQEASAKMAGALEQYVKAHPEAMKDPSMQGVFKILKAGKEGQEKLQGAQTQITEGAAALKGASHKLNEGAQATAAGIATVDGHLQELAVGAKDLASGTSQLLGASQTLSSGLVTIDQGSSKLLVVGQKLLDGEAKLQVGVETLGSGVKEAHDGVVDATSEANEKLTKTKDVDQFVSEPVVMQDSKINPIPDYGTAFTPYFVSLSLWVGALMMFFGIYLDNNMRSKRADRKLHPALQYLFYTAIGLGQAMIVAFVLLNVLHLQVTKPLYFYLACGAIALTFTAIMRFLLVHVGDVGKFIGVLWLILQLTACGGTFPMELVPTFFQDINPFMPMTYTVNVLKEVISGIDRAYLIQNTMVLLGIGGVFTLINISLALLKRGKNVTDQVAA